VNTPDPQKLFKPESRKSRLFVAFTYGKTGVGGKRRVSPEKISLA
jgi:hypothetical protein